MNNTPLTQDIRWEQRFANFKNAFLQLERAVELSRTRMLSELEKQGVIQGFEYTHELAWNVLKDFLEYQGVFNAIGSRDSCREGFQRGLITRGDEWMEMIRSRNLTSHSYNKKIADEIMLKITLNYYACFLEFKEKMEVLVQK